MNRGKSEVFDVIVIGSGFGGAVAASSLISAGRKVLLLERGPWRDTRPVRMAGIDERSPLPAGRHFYSHILHRIGTPFTRAGGICVNRRGLFDLHLSSDMSVVCSSGVGGGSHVYSAMNTRPAAATYWDNRSPDISAAAMEEHYQWMLQTMGSREPQASDQIPNFTGDRFTGSDHFVADEHSGQPAMSVRMEADADDYRNNSFFGSANGAKATLDQVLLLPAMTQGLEIRALHECLSLWRTAQGYRLEVIDHQQQRIHQLHARQVVVAAGTLNTLRLLFRSRALGGISNLPALGRGFGGNGDVPAYWAMNQSGTDFSTGTPCHGRFALRDAASGTPQTLPDCLPVDLTSYGLNGIDQIPMPGFLRRRLRRDLIVVGMGADNADGIADWHNGRLRLRYLQDNNPILASVYSHLDEIARRSGKPVHFRRRHALTVHPLGGARLAATPSAGVVNSQGEVWNNPGLFIADASALPAAPGTPPSMTIAAWARHVALHMTHHNNKSSRRTPV